MGSSNSYSCLQLAWSTSLPSRCLILSFSFRWLYQNSSSSSCDIFGIIHSTTLPNLIQEFLWYKLETMALHKKKCIRVNFSFDSAKMWCRRFLHKKKCLRVNFSFDSAKTFHFHVGFEHFHLNFARHFWFSDNQ